MFPFAAFGQGAFIPAKTVLGTVSGTTHPIAGATVTVCAANSPGAPCSPALSGVLFKDAGLTQPLPNPTTADANGNYQFAIAAGTYTVTETAVGFTGYSYQLSVTCTLGACTISSLTITGALTTGGPNTLGGNTSVGALSATSVTDSGLTTGNCVQASPGGLLATVSGPCGTSSGTITATGTPAPGNLTKFSGATSITNADLTGDVTTSGTTATTVGKVNGVSYPSGPSNSGVPVVTASNTVSYVVVPNCLDSSGQHLNYNNTTFSFICGTSVTTSINFGRNTSVCSTGAGAGSSCTTTISLNFTEPDTNYAVAVSCVTPSGFPTINVSSKATGSVTIILTNGTASEAQVSSCSEVDVVVTGT